MFNFDEEFDAGQNEEDDQDPFQHEAEGDTASNSISLHAATRLAGTSYLGYHAEDGTIPADGSFAFASQPNYEKLPTPFIPFVNADGSKSRVRTRRTWYEPLFWFLSQLRWSRKDYSGDLLERRVTTCTFVELALAADILTGGAIGPRHAPLSQKVTIFKHFFHAILRQCGLTWNGKPTQPKVFFSYRDAEWLTQHRACTSPSDVLGSVCDAGAGAVGGGGRLT